MKRITLRVRDGVNGRVDCSRFRLDEWCKQSIGDIQQQSLSVSESVRDSLPRSDRGAVGRLSSDPCIGDLFHVSVEAIDNNDGELQIEGGGLQLNGLGHQHRAGDIRVEGDVGDHCGSCMTGGRIVVNGEAGKGVGSPLGTRGIGMSGGSIRVSGDVGDLAGHRMRRGDIHIAGSAGDGLASFQIAGTIWVDGSVGENVAYGMKRGTLILSQPLGLPQSRFTTAIELRSPFTSIIGLSKNSPDDQWTVRRGDRCVNGIGEIWMPALHQ